MRLILKQKRPVLAVFALLFSLLMSDGAGATSHGFHPSFLSEAEILYLERKGALSVCIDPKWMPYEAIDENGEHIGISADYIQLIEDSLGTEIYLVQTQSWRETLTKAKNRVCDILAMARPTDERRSFLNFSPPYISFPYVVLTRSNAENLGQIAEHTDKSFAVVEGYAVVSYLKDNFSDLDLTMVNDIDEGFELVKSGAVDGYIDSSVTLEHYMGLRGGGDLKLTGQTNFNSFLSIATRNDEPMLQTIMDKALDRISGVEKRAIHRKWIKVRR